MSRRARAGGRLWRPMALGLLVILLCGCDAERGGVSAPSWRWFGEMAEGSPATTPTRTTSPVASYSATRVLPGTPSSTRGGLATATPRQTTPVTSTATAAKTATATATSRPPATATPQSTETPVGPRPAPPEAVHSGEATYYYATGGGACSFEPSPEDLMVAALNEAYYGQADLCGAFVEVTGPRGVVVVRIVDLCPGCLEVNLDLDLSQQAFEAIAELAKGRVAVSWRVVSPKLSGPIAYHFAEGSNRWWTGIQIRNHRNPVARLEYRDASGAWVNVPRKAWNYFVQTSPGMGTGPYELRVTDIYGNQIIDPGVPLTPGGTVQGSEQFPAGTGH